MSDFDSIFDGTEEGNRAHSRFAPSSLARILVCPQSAPAPGQTSGAGSVYAAEGTVAHTVAEAILRGVQPPPLGRQVTVDGHTINVNADMVSNGLKYAQYVRGLASHPADKVYVELTVNMDAALPGAGMYGHLDAAVWSPFTSTLKIIDYKYGRGVTVSALDNAQLKAYAYGALTSIPDLDPDDVKFVECHIFQPRVSSPSPPDMIPVVDLLMWMQGTVKPVIDAIQLDGAANYPYVTGTHCRWCPKQAVCPALRERALQSARKAFAGAPISPHAASTKELVQTADEAAIIRPYLDAVEKELMARIKISGSQGGWSLVPTRPVRVWAKSDVDTVAELARRGVVGVLEQRLRSPAQVESILPDGTDISDLLTTKSGGVKLSKSAGKGATAAEVFSKSPLAQKDPD